MRRLSRKVASWHWACWLRRLRILCSWTLAAMRSARGKWQLVRGLLAEIAKHAMQQDTINRIVWMSVCETSGNLQLTTGPLVLTVESAGQQRIITFNVAASACENSGTWQLHLRPLAEMTESTAQQTATTPQAWPAYRSKWLKGQVASRLAVIK